MLEDPGLDAREATEALGIAYGIAAAGFTFVPSYDMQSASYSVATIEGRFFLKIHFGPVAGAPLDVPRALLEGGIASVLAPIRTVASTLWHPMDGGRTAVLFPFVAGQNAMVAGMTAGQWREFGTALRGVHDSGLQERFADRLPAESFALPSAAVARAVLAQRPAVDSPAANRLSDLFAARAGRIGSMIQRAEELGSILAGRPVAHVLCHADIHAANVLVADDGRIYLVDWDGPMLAPRERDLLFVIGSRIARDVLPHEEGWFFEGYGEVSVDREALVYYRYERILEDIGEFARSVFGDPAIPEASRLAQVMMVDSFFGPDGIVETVEA